jgi:cytochrome bd ubiquinol oxidase subunit II
VVTGWGVAQYPEILVDAATIEDVAGADVTLQLLLGVVVAAGIIVVPSLVWLLRLVDQPRWK